MLKFSLTQQTSKRGSGKWTQSLVLMSAIKIGLLFECMELTLSLARIPVVEWKLIINRNTAHKLIIVSFTSCLVINVMDEKENWNLSLRPQN